MLCILCHQRHPSKNNSSDSWDGCVVKLSRFPTICRSRKPTTSSEDGRCWVSPAFTEFTRQMTSLDIATSKNGRCILINRINAENKLRIHHTHFNLFHRLLQALGDVFLGSEFPAMTETIRLSCFQCHIPPFRLSCCFSALSLTESVSMYREIAPLLGQHCVMLDIVCLCLLIVYWTLLAWFDESLLSNSPSDTGSLWAFCASDTFQLTSAPSWVCQRRCWIISPFHHFTFSSDEELQSFRPIFWRKWQDWKNWQRYTSGIWKWKETLNSILSRWLCASFRIEACPACVMSSNTPNLGNFRNSLQRLLLCYPKVVHKGFDLMIGVGIYKFL